MPENPGAAGTILPRKASTARKSLAVLALFGGLLLLVVYVAAIAGLWSMVKDDAARNVIDVSVSADGMSMAGNSSPSVALWRCISSVLGTVAGAACAIGLAMAFRRYSLLAALIALMIVGALGALPFMLVPPQKNDSAVTIKLRCAKLPDKEVAALRKAMGVCDLEETVGPGVLKALGCTEGLPVADVDAGAFEENGDWGMRFVCFFDGRASEAQRRALSIIFFDVVLARAREALARNGLPDSAGSGIEMGTGSPADAVWRKRAAELRLDRYRFREDAQ